MFGTYGELDPAEVAKAEAIRDGFSLVGLLARAFVSGSPGRIVGRHDAVAGAAAAPEPPCPDALPGQAETPCVQRERELLAKAAVLRAARRR